MKYTRELLEPLVKDSDSFSEVARRLGKSPRNGRGVRELKDAVTELEIDYSHFGYGSRKYSKEILESLVAESSSIAEVMRKLGLTFLAGGTHYHLSRRIKEFGIDTSHFLGRRSQLGKTPSNKRTPEQRLVLRETGKRELADRLRRSLIEAGVKHECLECGCSSEWNGKKLVLQIDHINGNPLDDRKENLRFLCPNCHSQTPTFSRNRAGVSELEYEQLLESCAARLEGSNPSPGTNIQP